MFNRRISNEILYIEVNGAKLEEIKMRSLIISKACLVKVQCSLLRSFNFNKLGVEENLGLIAEFTDEKIKRAVSD